MILIASEILGSRPDIHTLGEPMLDMMHSGGVVVLLKLWCGGVWDLGGGDLGCWGGGVLEE